jgi:hypothetical protein
MIIRVAPALILHSLNSESVSLGPATTSATSGRESAHFHLTVRPL